MLELKSEEEKQQAKKYTVKQKRGGDKVLGEWKNAANGDDWYHPF